MATKSILATITKKVAGGLSLSFLARPLRDKSICQASHFCLLRRGSVHSWDGGMDSVHANGSALMWTENRDGRSNQGAVILTCSGIYMSELGGPCR